MPLYKKIVKIRRNTGEKRMRKKYINGLYNNWSGAFALAVKEILDDSPGSSQWDKTFPIKILLKIHLQSGQMGH